MKKLKIYVGFPGVAEGKQVMQPEGTVKEVKSNFVRLGKLAESIGWSKHTS
jgi:hypothetical protein